MKKKGGPELKRKKGKKKKSQASLFIKLHQVS